MFKTAIYVIWKLEITAIADHTGNAYEFTAISERVNPTRYSPLITFALDAANGFK